MSGHSKWSNIKRKKAVLDEKKGKIFSKLSRAISVAAREGGGDPEMNPALRLAVDKAKEASMPKDNIERAIKKGSGELAGGSYEEAVYEGYGPEGVAFLIKCLTDNKNRTVSEIRNLLSRFEGSMGGAGSTAYIFAEDPESPSFTIPIQDKAKAGKILELFEELEDHDDVQEVYANFDIPEGMLEEL